MADMTALWREDADTNEVVAAYQELINSGQCWHMEGHTGRTAMQLIEDGYCILGEVGHKDYWGHYVPSRTEVKAGTKGSVEYAHNLTGFKLNG